jgi:5'-phosphate synthase pdxT subunit
MQALRRCGVAAREVRKPADLEGLSGLIIPGGESTVMALIARNYGIFDPLRELGRQGLPMFGTCAGAILLGRGEPPPPRLELIDVEVDRNAYGTQVDSFSADIRLTPFEDPFHCVFIRAPKIRLPAAPPAASIEVLGTHADDPVLCRSGHFLLATFHPELTADLRVHRFFLEQCV